MCLLNCIKGLVSNNLSLVNMWTSPKNCGNLQKSTFILLLHHSEAKCLRKCKSILVKCEILGLVVNALTTDYEYFRSNRESLRLSIQRQFSEYLNFFSKFVLKFRNVHSICKVLKKNEPHTSNSCEVTNSERHAYLNA